MAGSFQGLGSGLPNGLYLTWWRKKVCTMAPSKDAAIVAAEWDVWLFRQLWARPWLVAPAPWQVYVNRSGALWLVSRCAMEGFAPAALCNAREGSCNIYGWMDYSMGAVVPPTSLCSLFSSHPPPPPPPPPLSLSLVPNWCWERGDSLGWGQAFSMGQRAPWADLNVLVSH